MKTTLPLAVTLLVSTMFAPVLADGPAPAVPLRVATAKPLTPVTDVLTSLSRQSGVPILSDDTVVDTIGVTTVDKPDLDSILTVLVSLGQGASWQRVYLPAAAPLPDASTLSAQVRALRDIAASGLLIVDPTAESITFSRSTQPASTQPASGQGPAGMRLVYLVTNEKVRAERIAALKASEAKRQAGAAPTAPVDHAVAGMQTAADDLGQMTPDQQRQAIPLMFQQMMRMIQNIDPAVRDELRQQWQQRGGQGGGAVPTP